MRTREPSVSIACVGTGWARRGHRTRKHASTEPRWLGLTSVSRPALTQALPWWLMRTHAHTFATTDLPSNLRPCNFSLAMLADEASLNATKILPMCSSAGVTGSLGGCGRGMIHATTWPNLVHSSICGTRVVCELCMFASRAPPQAFSPKAHEHAHMGVGSVS